MHFKIIFLSAFLISSKAFSQQIPYIEETKQKWTNAKQYTLEVAEIMPEENYNFKPTEDEMTFREQLVHLSGNMLWLSSTFLGTDKPKITTKDFEGQSKAKIIELVAQSFDFVDATIEKMSLDQLNEFVDFGGRKLSKRQIIWLINDHLTHHRAQAIVYLRLKAQKPPKYIGW